jgi:hypothetical protein
VHDLALYRLAWARASKWRRGRARRAACRSQPGVVRVAYERRVSVDRALARPLSALACWLGVRAHWCPMLDHLGDSAHVEGDRFAE